MTLNQQATVTLSSFLRSQIKPLSVCLILSLSLAACGKQEPVANGMAMPAMPVGVITLQATNVPIAAETVAQTEGAKEVEIRPRVGGIVLKKLFEEGAPIKQGQALFLIDPVPFQIALSNAKAQLAQQQAKLSKPTRSAALKIC